MAIKHSDVVVTDNKGIQDYVTEEYGKESVLIEYGGDHVICDVGEEEKEVLERFCLKKETYSLALCRIEPENNVEMILKAFSESNEIVLKRQRHCYTIPAAAVLNHSDFRISAE